VASAPCKAKQTTSSDVRLESPTYRNPNTNNEPKDAPEKIPYAINRYQTETNRLYQVLNDRLASERKTHNLSSSDPAYLVGNKFTLSDICVFSWVNWGEWAGVEPSAYPEIKLWVEDIEKRPAVEKGMNVPDDFRKMKETMKDSKKSEEYAKKSSGWIMKGMKEEEERKKL
jgi:glutathione S-transferase